MKKLVAAFLAVLTLTAGAEWNTVGTVQLADNVTLAKGVARLGDFTGNMLLGMMATGSLKNLPGTAAFGKGRKGASTLYPLFAENGRYQFAMLYPVAITKEAFLKKYPGAVESNGLIRVECPLLGKDPVLSYVAFSKDGKWAGAGVKPQQARLALNEIAAAEKPLDGDMVKVRFLKRGLIEFMKGGEREADPIAKDVVGQLSGAVIGLRFSERGLDIRGLVKPVAGTELAKVGKKPLAANPLAFAGRDSLWGSAIAADCGQRRTIAQMWKELKPLVEKTGFNLDWLEYVERSSTSKFTIDLGRFLAYVKTLDGDKRNLDEKALDELKRYFAGNRRPDRFTAAAPAFNCEFALKGYAGKFLPAQRFTYTLPEVAEKKPFAVGFFSLYSFIRTLLPALSKSDPDAFPGIGLALAALPAEGQGGMAYMAWSDNAYLRFFLRIGADEFKAVSAGFAAFASMAVGKDSDGSDED